MLDLRHTPSAYAGAAGQQIFIGTMTTATTLSQTWVKPRGISMVSMLILGQGGKGANSVVGATSAGGAGGGSGAQSHLIIPASSLPDILYVGAGSGGGGTAVATIVAARPLVLHITPYHWRRIHS